MKRVMIFAVLLATLSFLGCKSKSAKETSPETIANLKAGIKTETTASSKYASFAQKAKEEGLEPIAHLFKALARSENIHAADHLKVLRRLGEKVEPIIPEFEVKTTQENMQEAIKGESYAFMTMYPVFMKQAEEENAQDAAISFMRALDTEKKHGNFCQKALEALNNSSELASLPRLFLVCPNCGNTFNEAKVTATCDFCRTPRKKFIPI